MTLQRAYSYIRFSTPEQAKGSSLARQIEAAKRYAKDNNLLLDDSLTFKDLGVSAYDASNLGPGSELGRFLELVKVGRVPRGSYLLIESLDRLSRATISVALQLLLGLLNEGIVVVTLLDKQRYEQTNTSSDFTQLIISLTILQRANEESKTKGERVGTAWRKKREAAASQKLTRMCPAWLRLSDDRSHYIEIPERVAVVRRIIDLAQSVGRDKIARMLNDEGVKSIAPARVKHSADNSRSNPEQEWYPSYIAKLLTNRALVGEFQPHRIEKTKLTDKGKRVPAGLPVPGYFPALIDEAEFAVLQADIEERGSKTGGRKGAGFSNIFTGLLKCGYCGGSLVYINKGEDQRGNRDVRRNKYVVCSRANRGLACHKVPWVYHELEDSFFAYATKTNFADFVASTNARRGDVRLLRDQLTIAEQALGKNDGQQQKLVDFLLGDSSDPRAVRDRLNELQAAATALSAEVNQLRSQLLVHEQQSTQSKEALEALQQVRSEVQAKTGEGAYVYRASLNQHLRRMIDKIELYPGGLLATDAERAEARIKLLASVHDEEAADAVLAQTFRTKPDVKQRVYMICSRGDALQVLQPDADVPDFEEQLKQVRNRTRTKKVEHG